MQKKITLGILLLSRLPITCRPASPLVRQSTHQIDSPPISTPRCPAISQSETVSQSPWLEDHSRQCFDEYSGLRSWTRPHVMSTWFEQSKLCRTADRPDDGSHDDNRAESPNRFCKSPSRRSNGSSGSSKRIETTLVASRTSTTTNTRAEFEASLEVSSKRAEALSILASRRERSRHWLTCGSWHGLTVSLCRCNLKPSGSTNSFMHNRHARLQYQAINSWQRLSHRALKGRTISRSKSSWCPM